MMVSTNGHPAHRKKYTYRLTGYGRAEEVWEVAQELDFYDSAFAVKFLEKAFDAGVRFTLEQVLEMEGTVERSFLSRLAEQSDGVFSLEELEDIDGLIDDNSFRKISSRAGSEPWMGRTNPGWSRKYTAFLPRNRNCLPL
ncbi:MAG: hypothetical protein V8Q30_13795 [Acutalibacteraceae bacterium]